jgi:hypothetical protein
VEVVVFEILIVGPVRTLVQLGDPETPTTI